MKHSKFIRIVLFVIILSFFSPGCVETPNGTPVATPVAAVQETAAVNTPTIAPAMTARTPLSYKVYVDESLGFKRVIETTYKNEVQYKNLTLTIYTGDNVEWVEWMGNNFNDIITIVSDQGLWVNGSGRLMNNKGFNYTFSNPGNYTFRVKEEPRLLPQMITVIP